MKGFATRVYNSHTEEYETDFFVNIDDAMYVKERYFNVSLYYAHTEKKGFNTIIVLDGRVRKQDGTPI